jgi:dinuclear metal center YbgI/SA1388 family protein
MNRSELVPYLDTFLRVAEIKDYGPQGLQVESDNAEIRRIALAVDVAPSIIAAAAEWNADMLLVHHGILWRDVQRIAGGLGARVRALLKHGINLYAAHLPLDAHPEVGNNAVLGKMFGLTKIEWWGAAYGTPLGVVGELATPLPLEQFARRVDSALDTHTRTLKGGLNQVHKLAVLSGFGADRVAEVAALGADTYVTGETSHQNFYAAYDHKVNVIFAGHYATETVGVQALGAHLSDKFGLETHFFDFPTRM